MAAPTRVVIFSRVEGCGTGRSNAIRQNRRYAMESATSLHTVSNPIAVLEDHHPQVGLDRDRRPTVARVEEPRNGARNRPSSNNRSTSASPGGSPRHCSGKMASHNVGLAFIVRIVMARIPSRTRGSGHHLNIRPLNRWNAPPATPYHKGAVSTTVETAGIRPLFRGEVS